MFISQSASVCSVLNQKQRNRIVLFCLGFCFFSGPFWGFCQQQTRLSKIRRDIQRLESELRKKDQEETTLLEQVEDLEREIGLREKFIVELDVELSALEKKVRNAEIHLNETIKGYQRLAELIKSRMLRMYKRGRFMDWEVLFSIRSLNQAVVWLKYQKRIIESDRRNLTLLERKKRDIENLSSELNREIQKKTQIVQEKKGEKEGLELKKSDRSRLLTQIRKEKAPLLEQLEEKKIAYQQIEKRIGYEEKKRKSSIQKLDGIQFTQSKGKMRWPVEGEIVTKYGRQRHPDLKTWTENLGIDIQTSEGASVLAVCRGIVRYVTWLRGMGNLVLLDHGGGYYSVYGHLAVVFVEPNDELKGGTIIGQVGEAQGLYRSRLHFEIWKEQNHFNPLAWLK